MKVRYRHPLLPPQNWVVSDMARQLRRTCIGPRSRQGSQ